MSLVPIPTTDTERLEDLELTIRHLLVLAEHSPATDRPYLVHEAIELDNELWRLQLRCANEASTSALDGAIADLEAATRWLHREVDAATAPVLPLRRKAA